MMCVADGVSKMQNASEFACRLPVLLLAVLLFIFFFFFTFFFAFFRFASVFCLFKRVKDQNEAIIKMKTQKRQQQMSTLIGNANHKILRVH